ncbi:DUF4181 domain-containing protein [Bacillus wiedmannii]|jgi:uncharacterized membrane protein|uniref:DUF4181 domain-containing protein n=1 Tax=Bacillus wiedmannii TaxID=1890302 RepID=A0A2C4Q8Y7_9BACI|nr:MULTISPECIES: DUF4181 domain-containing protein [Bacillus]AZJ20875.1 DUF4181 domain-containing protein [Bacillus wiedmannii bv. thuringiensis]KAA0745666.1 DUF4181 domain-containing protein [Bacillus sp. AY3-1]KAA0775178.1 DUF4181 domain-containing protein [Bacillus sp. AR2-1]KPU57471.1 hypothetical protein AN402_4579 [Bacillus wiedmannii]MCP9279438.1 DUF4181 domain-containing protein [Bacillus wiedmannii]
MGISTILIIIIGLAIGGYFLEQCLRIKLNMEKRGFFGYKHVNSLHVKIEIGLIIIYIIGSCYYMFKFENSKMAYVMFIYLGISSTLRAWMEWKYDRESKEYILSITGMVAFILMLSILVYFVPPAA